MRLLDDVCLIGSEESSGDYYYRLYWVRALIRHYLTTGRKYMYVCIKKYALNKHMRLLMVYNIIIPTLHKPFSDTSTFLAARSLWINRFI